ncbi:hypothetical protein QL285_052523 [Trifolium repens]|nr:hypothetical protein QL285_052523 [Trifolium repens]
MKSNQIFLGHKSKRKLMFTKRMGERVVRIRTPIGGLGFSEKNGKDRRWVVVMLLLLLLLLLLFVILVICDGVGLMMVMMKVELEVLSWWVLPCW